MILPKNIRISSIPFRVIVVIKSYCHNYSSIPLKNSFSYENCTFQTFKSNHLNKNSFYPFDLTKRAMRSIPFSICSSEHAKDKRT
ncbi:hypothetical protein DD771_03565 [Helicobacter pylori]|nr:hypothetical protein DD771_03565 [Helicobacter pylori]